MRTTNRAARGGPLAALLFLVVLLMASWSLTARESVGVYQTIDWGEVQRGVRGEPERANLMLYLEGLGPDGGYPIDCVLIIDVSATADLANAKTFAFDLIKQFSPQDRIGLVSYSTSARLEIPLEGGRTQLKTAIGDLTTGGKSALGLAMQMARRELLQAGREDALLVEILLSDGQSNVGIEPGIEGEIAADAGIRIISIGIGNLINRSLLAGFAADTGGLFFPRPVTDALSEIRDHLETEIAAKKLRIEKRFPAGIRLVTASPSATRDETRADGTTSAVWQMAELLIGQELTIRMELEALREGAWTMDADSLVSYIDFRGVEGSIEIPTANWPPMALFEYAPEGPTTADTVQFIDRSTDANDAGEIVSWLWNFGDGTVSRQQNPEHRFVEEGTYEVRLAVTDDQGASSVAYEAEIYVGNTPPSASFSTRGTGTEAERQRDITMADQPRVGVKILLDASSSYDFDDSIVKYEWDFDGDGVVDKVTTSPEVSYTFDTPGEHRVVLTVVDSKGGRASEEKTVDVIPTVMTKRTLETGLPDSWTLPGGVVKVTLTLSLNTEVNGLAVTETVPAGWTFTEVANDGATVRKNGQVIEWLFLERFATGGVNSKREIRYTLTAPDSVTEMVQATIRGTLGSSSPRITQTIGGGDRVTVTPILPVQVVISRWVVEPGESDIAAAGLDPFLGETIGFDQIQYAVSLWLSGAEVPYTGGATIGLATMQDLIAYWLTESSVHDPLP